MKRIGVICATAALLMFGNAGGAFSLTLQQHDDRQDKEHGKKDKQNKDDKHGEKGGPPPQVQQVPQPQPTAIQQQQALQQQALRNQQAQQQFLAQAAISQQEMRQRIALQQQRTAAYQAYLNEQVRVAQAQNVQLEQRRRSQLEIQQQYASRLRQQQLQVQRDRDYNYGNDAFFNTPWNYRYELGGRYRETNRYGAELLQQAVDYGYQEGFRAGDADRRDRWPYSFRDSFAYRDANYGYVGRYVDRSDYNYYFRLGFRKGYDDGYYRRSRYGRRVGNNHTILKVVLSGILKLEVIR